MIASISSDAEDRCLSGGGFHKARHDLVLASWPQVDDEIEHQGAALLMGMDNEPDAVWAAACQGHLVEV